MFDHEFIKQVAEASAEATAVRISAMLQAKNAPARVRIDGVRGIADFLRCSTATAQGMVNEGRFPIYHVGRKIFCYSDEVEAGIREKEK